jgi:hypothetical protein
MKVMSPDASWMKRKARAGELAAGLARFSTLF